MRNDKAFGGRQLNMSIDDRQVIPASKMRRPKHPKKIVIRPGLVIYAKADADVKLILEKYRGK